MTRMMTIVSGCILFAALCLAIPQYCCASTPAEILPGLSEQVDQSADATDAFKAYVKENLLTLCTNEVFISAIKAQNAKKATLDAIKKIDAEWSAAEDELPIQRELMHNAVAAEIRKLAKTATAMTEVFVMDCQGANVGQNSLTSDYWQGDEPKFIKSFNEGKGGVDIDKPKLDKSTNKVDQKISLPILDADGSVIGAICIGLSF